MKRCVNHLPDRKINEEYATSFNSKNCVTQETELIIVGTITPPEGKGYFYTAPRNKIYGYIDEVRGTNLKALKVGLNSGATKVDDIVKTLKEQRIAFLDVMHSVVRKQESCADDDISAFCLDFDTFQAVFTQGNNIKKVICNSRLAEDCYKEIKKELRCLPEAEYIPQRSRIPHKQKWLDALR